MQKNIILLALFLLNICSWSTTSARSIFRPTPTDVPMIDVSYEGETDFCRHIESHYEPIIFNVFDHDFFMNRLLPESRITYRYDPHKSVNGKILSNLIENLVAEIHQGFTTFTDFVVLKRSTFNVKLQAGLIVLRFKKYPFIVKLSIETPESFIQPLSKGTQPNFIFYMAGGMNRHLTGFTRIKNLEYVQAQFSKNATWKNCITFPRKWHWLSRNQKWLCIKGTNIGTCGTLTTCFPSIYAVIADEINIERTFQQSNQNDRHTAMSLSKYVHSFLDAHIDNFCDEKYTGKIAIIDTEHFPSVVGFRQEPPGEGYFAWYSHMANKMIGDTFFRSKPERKAAQARGPSPLSIP